MVTGRVQFNGTIKKQALFLSHQWKHCADYTAGITCCVPKDKCPLLKLGPSAACMSLQKRHSTGLSTGNRLIWWRLPFMESLTITACSRNLRRLMDLTFIWGGADWMTYLICNTALFFPSFHYVVLCGRGFCCLLYFLCRYLRNITSMLPFAAGKGSRTLHASISSFTSLSLRPALPL